MPNAHRDRANSGGRRWPGPFPWGTLWGVPILAATMAVCAIMGTLGWLIPAIFAAVIAGLMMMVAARAVGAWSFAGLLLCGVIGLMGAMIEVPLFGPTVRGIPVARAAEHPGAAIFHFTDGRVLEEMSGDVGVYGGSKGVGSHELHRLRIAPVVGDGWTPGQPVTAWAVTHSPNSALPPTDWARPSRAGVRVVSTSESDIREEIVRVVRGYRLVSIDRPVLLRWMDDPEAGVSRQYGRLFVILSVCVALWGGVVLLGWLLPHESQR